MYTLIIFLMLEGGYERIEKVEHLSSLEDCRAAGAEALKAFKTPRNQVQVSCVREPGK